jgi:hypothetical protein
MVISGYDQGIALMPIAIFSGSIALVKFQILFYHDIRYASLDI